MQDANIIELPITKALVTVKGFLTTGQSRQLQRILLTQGVMSKDGVNVENITPEAALDMQDKAASMLISGIKNADGSELTFTQEWLDNLPVTDGNVVYEELNRLVSEGSLSAEDKKK